MPVIGFIDAIRQALAEEMERDPSVFIMGEDVKLGAFAATRGLVDRFPGPGQPYVRSVYSTLQVSKSSHCRSACPFQAKMLFRTWTLESPLT